MSQIPKDEVLPLQHSEHFRRAGPIPELRLEAVLPRDAPSIVARSPDTTSSSNTFAITSCGPKDTTGGCERMVGATGNTTLPIVLGVVIPLTVAFVLLIILHRRHVKKLRREDAEDAQKSLDFGMDGSEKRKKRKAGGRVPEMSVSEARGAVRGDRGVSLDLGATNPYLLPPELQQSRESLHSLSRAMNTGDDKYRATTFIPDDGSIRSPSSLRSGWDDNSSTYTGTSKKKVDTESTKGLLPQPSTGPHEPLPTIRKPSPIAKDGSSLLAPLPQDHVRDSYLSTTSSNGAVAALRASNNYLGAFISGGGVGKKEKPTNKDIAVTSVVELEGSSPVSTPAAVARPDQPQKRKSIVPDTTSGFDFNIQPPQESAAPEHVTYHELATGKESVLPQLSITHSDTIATQARESSIYEENLRNSTHLVNDHQSKNHQIHDVPIEQGHSLFPDINSRDPAADHPHQTQEQVRTPSNLTVDHPGDQESDYYEEEDAYDVDEYRDVLGYDPRLLKMGQRPLPPDDPSENPEERALKIRSFYKEYFDDSAVKHGNGRVSYYDGSENYVDDYYGTNYSSPYGSRGPSRAGPPQARHRSTVSNGTYHGPRGRAFSAMSNRPGPRRPMQPRKNMPPPAPLHVLPTPHKLQDDSMLPNAIDFAPPQTFKNQRAGTPDSLRGGQRPFSPSTRAYNPLVSSFDDLAVLPSPHQLRKSGTFTSLDFAPPRFVGPENTGSETGSIRSNRSGVSALHQHNIRSGAYRVSRIPKEVAGTKIEMSNVLRPQWDMNR